MVWKRRNGNNTATVSFKIISRSAQGDPGGSRIYIPISHPQLDFFKKTFIEIFCVIAVPCFEVDLQKSLRFSS